MDNFGLATLTKCFSDLVDIRAHLVQPENDLLRARPPALKASPTFINFSRPSLHNFTAFGIKFPFLIQPGTEFCRNLESSALPSSFCEDIPL
jgi:hypothetical protein